MSALTPIELVGFSAYDTRRLLKMVWGYVTQVQNPGHQVAASVVAFRTDGSFDLIV